MWGGPGGQDADSRVGRVNEPTVRLESRLWVLMLLTCLKRGWWSETSLGHAYQSRLALKDNLKVSIIASNHYFSGFCAASAEACEKLLLLWAAELLWWSEVCVLEP